MNKRTIITILLAFVAMAGQAQTFIPVVGDSIDFVIEGTVSEGADSVCMEERPYTGPLWFPVHNKHFRIAVRQPLHKFLQIEDGRDGWMQIIVDNQPSHIVVDFRTNTVVEGSPLNKRFNHYKLIEDSIEKEMELHEEDDDRTVYNSLEQRLHDAEWKSIIENTDNVIPVYNLALNGQFCMITPERLTECMKEEYAFAHHPEMNNRYHSSSIRICRSRPLCPARLLGVVVRPMYWFHAFNERDSQGLRRQRSANHWPIIRQDS